MAYINGKDVLFGVQVNGILDGETTENADFGEIMKKWLSLNVDDNEITETYDLILPDWVNENTFNQLFLPNLHEKSFKSNTISLIDTNAMFADCSKLETVYLPACVSICSNCFRACESLTTVTLGAINSISSNSFNGCGAIKNFNIGTGATAKSLNLIYATKLTQESVHGIIDNYADMTDAGGAELRFAQDVYNNISEEYKQKAAAKGLTLWQSNTNSVEEISEDV